MIPSNRRYRGLNLLKPPTKKEKEREEIYQIQSRRGLLVVVKKTKTKNAFMYSMDT